MSQNAPLARQRRPGRYFAGSVALVASGGFIGTLMRFAMTEGVIDVYGWPIGTVVVNVVGAFCLGLLLVRISALSDSGRSHRLRLFAGTGLLGSFTTYSTFAVEAEVFRMDGDAGLAFGYVVGSVLAGFAACFTAVVVASRRSGVRGRIR